MPTFVALTHERHAGLGWKRSHHYTFAAQEALVSLAGAELSRAATAMPIAFVPKATGYQVVGVLSLQPGTNLFVAPGGQWLGAYIPAIWRGYPFRVLPAEGDESSVLCVDEASEWVVNADEAEAVFFDARGEPSAAVREMLDWLARLERQQAMTRRAVDALAEAGVIRPWTLHVERAGQKLSVMGLHRIDEAAFNALDEATHLELRRRQSLPVAYAQLLSMHQITVLEQLGQIQAQIAHLWLRQRTPALAEKLESFGLSEEDQVVRFD